VDLDPRVALVAYGQTLASLRWAIRTVCGLLIGAMALPVGLQTTPVLSLMVP